MKVSVGAVIEISTKRGLAYAQFSHWNELMGALVRVLPGLHDKRPSDLRALVRQRETYVTFLPIDAAVREGFVRVIAQEAVPAHAANLPLFRAAGPREPKTGRPVSWWLWDGKREWMIGELSVEQRDLPIRALVAPDVFIERLEEGWVPGKDFLRPVTRGTEESAILSRPGETTTQHYLYFRSQNLARRAAEAIQQGQYEIEVRESSTGSDWLVLVSTAEDQPIESVKVQLEEIASHFGGDYDGWEAATGK